MGLLSLDELGKLQQHLSRVLTPVGFECHPFKVGWYNEQVSKHFLLPYHHDTVAFIIISTPSMFEEAFIPYINAVDCERTKQDPLDQCMVHHFSTMKKEFPDVNIETIHDFEVTASKRPRVLVQTAGHVSGAVRYYQRQDVSPSRWNTDKKIFGVCVHPEFGGWFALRGVAIFTTLTCADLPHKLPREVLSEEEKIVELLERYNNHWQDWSFRDIVPVKERYSQQQCTYFSTKPADRHILIQQYQSLKQEA